MKNTQAVLRVKNLDICLPSGADRPLAVENIHFDLFPGEILCIVGESGSGKSMSSNAIMGLLPAPHVKVVRGSIQLEGEELLELSEPQMQNIRGSRVGMIFQEPMTALNPVMKIGEQLEEVLLAHQSFTKAERKRKIIEMLNDVGLPDPEIIGNSYPFALSGGQRQRVMISMALALEPAVLIADEPTTALDVTTQAQILKLIKELQISHGMGVIFITHDFGVVAEIADRVIVMQEGKIVEQGDAQQVLNAPQHPYTQKLIAAVPSLQARETSTQQPETVISVRNLCKTYRSQSSFWEPEKRTVYASKNISFDIKKGETLGLVGESGSGKSTVGRSIIRLHNADSGEVIFDGKNILTLNNKEMMPIRHQIQMIFQDPYASLNPRRKIGDIIAEGPVIHGENKQTAYAKAAELLSLVGLDASALKRYPHEFSGGQRQRIGIARALAMQPKLLIADEAVSALDVSVQAQVLELLDEIKQKMQLAMLFVTHDLRIAAKICDHIAVMRQGEIVEYGSTEKVFGSPQHAYTQQLLDAIPGKAWDAMTTGSSSTTEPSMAL